MEYWTGHLRDMWNLPLENCQSTDVAYENRNWIGYTTEVYELPMIAETTGTFTAAYAAVSDRLESLHVEICIHRRHCEQTDRRQTYIHTGRQTDSLI